MSLAHVASVGARGPLGPTALSVAMGVRAGLREPRSCHLLDKSGRAVRICLTGGLGPELYGYDRLLGLGAPALAAAAAPLGNAPLPLVLAVAEPGRPDDDERLATDLWADLARDSRVSLDVASSTLVRVGHAGGASALERALELLRQGAPQVAVGGVDSYYHPEVIASLDEAHRLQARGVEDGFVPSEAAAFCVLVASSRRRREDEVEPLCALSHVAVQSERSVGGDEPNLARAMTELLRGIANDSGPIGWALPDLNGERHRTRQWQMAALRGSLEGDARIDRMVQQLGEVGAATGPALLATAACWWQVSCAPAEDCVVALHSEGAERGVFRLERIAEAEES